MDHRIKELERKRPADSVVKWDKREHGRQASTTTNNAVSVFVFVFAYLLFADPPDWG